MHAVVVFMVTLDNLTYWLVKTMVLSSLLGLTGLADKVKSCQSFLYVHSL